MRTVFLLLTTLFASLASAQNVHLSGQIADYTGNNCDEFAVKALDVSGGQELAFSLSNAQGQFELDLEAISTPFSVKVKPAGDDQTLSGLNTYDMVLIARHILNIQPLTNPYAIIAADINNSGQVTFMDVFDLRKLLLGIDPQQPDDAWWRFIPQNWTFQEPLNPFNPPFPTDIELLNVTQSVSGLDFYAINVGDVNGSACNNLTQQDDRSPIALSLDDRWLNPGETVEVPLFFSENTDWIALQGSLEFDPEKVDIEALTANHLPAFTASNWAVPHTGLLNLTWNDVKPQHLRNDQAALTLHLRAKTGVRLSDALTSSARGLRPEAYTDNGSARIWALQFRQTLPTTMRVLGVQPNPTHNDARLSVELPSETALHLEIFDATGRLTFSNNQTLPAGQQIIEIPTKALSASGIYTWRVSAGTFSQSGQILKD